MNNKFAFIQSGAMGFFGNTLLYEYWYQFFYQFLPGYNFDELTFVSKTATLNPRKGNTALRKNKYGIRALYPTSIWVSPKSLYHGYMLNAIGLSNPGLKFMLKQGEWQKRKDEHFQISIQIESTRWEDIEKEIREICRLLNKYLPPSIYSYDLQMNDSCPNTEHGIGINEEKVTETRKKLELFKELLPNIDVWIKYNALIATQVLIALKKYCAGYILSNTIPFGDETSNVDWHKWFKGGKSPLPKRLGKPFEGGLSGKIIFDDLLFKLDSVEKADPTLSIIAGGGIMEEEQIELLSKFNVVKGVAFGTVALMRPWRVSRLSNFANEIFAKKA